MYPGSFFLFFQRQVDVPPLMFCSAFSVRVTTADENQQPLAVARLLKGGTSASLFSVQKEMLAVRRSCSLFQVYKLQNIFARVPSIPVEASSSVPLN